MSFVMTKVDNPTESLGLVPGFQRYPIKLVKVKNPKKHLTSIRPNRSLLLDFIQSGSKSSLVLYNSKSISMTRHQSIKSVLHRNPSAYFGVKITRVNGNTYLVKK